MFSESRSKYVKFISMVLDRQSKLATYHDDLLSEIRRAFPVSSGKAVEIIGEILLIWLEKWSFLGGEISYFSVELASP